MRFSSAAIGVLLLLVASRAPSSPPVQDATAHAVERFLPSSRSLGFGGSLVVQTRDVSAVFWNPAALSGLRDREITFNLNETFGYNFAGLSQFIPTLGAWGIALSRLPISTTRAADTAGSSISRGTLAWGYELLPGISVGSSVSIDKLNDELTATGALGFFVGNNRVGTLNYAFREGPSASVWDQLNFGFAVRNLPVNGKNFEPAALLGLSYGWPLHGLILNSGYHIQKGDNSLHAGVGYELSRRLMLMSGLADFDFDALGVGLAYTGDNFRVDLAYGARQGRFLLTVSARISESPRVLAEAHYENAEAHIKRGEYALAAKEFKRFLSYDVSDARSDRVRRVLASLERRLARTQFIVDSLYTVSEKLMDQDDPQKLMAALILNRVLELDPDHVKARRNLRVLFPVIEDFVAKSFQQGEQAFADGDYVEARKQFKKVLLFRKSDPRTQEYMREIDRLMSDLGEEYFYRGLVYYRQGNYQKAKQQFELALEHNADLEAAQSYLEQAREKVVELQARVNELIEAGQMQERRGDYVAAVKNYLKVLEIDNDNEVAESRIATLKPQIERFVANKFEEGLKHYRNGELARAEEAFRLVLSIDPEHRAARSNVQNLRREKRAMILEYLNQAEEQFNQQSWSEAMKLYEETLRLDPNNTVAQQGKAETQKQLQIVQLLKDAGAKYDAGEYLGAIEVYNQVLELDADNQAAKDGLQNCGERIEELVERYFNEGIRLYAQEQYREAIEHWDKALELNPKHARSAQYKQQALQRLEALEALKQPNE